MQLNINWLKLQGSKKSHESYGHAPAMSVFLKDYIMAQSAWING